MSEELRTMPRIVVDAAKLFAAHWPMLCTLALIGVAVRGGAVFAAIELSNVQGWLGQAFLLLAPLGYLLPIIAMLHLMRPSMPILQEIAEQRGADSPSERRERRLIDVAAAVLVPFLAVYISFGLLSEDLRTFTQAAAVDELNDYFGQGGDLADRISTYPVQILVMVVAVAWVLRWALGVFERRTQFIGFAFIGALVEVFYSGKAAQSWTEAKNEAWAWIESRQAVDWGLETYRAFSDSLGVWAHPIDWLTERLFSLVGSLDAVLTVPLAWLTVGAVVLGHKLNPAPEAKQRFGFLPAWLRTGLNSLFGDIASRWSAFTGAIRMMLRSGLLPMLLFCVVFLLALRLPTLVSMGVRQLLGPTDPRRWIAFSPIEMGLELALTMVVIAPLILAATAWMIAAQATPGAPNPALESGSDSDLMSATEA